MYVEMLAVSFLLYVHMSVFNSFLDQAVDTASLNALHMQSLMIIGQIVTKLHCSCTSVTILMCISWQYVSTDVPHTCSCTAIIAYYRDTQVLRVAATSGNSGNTTSAVRNGDISDEVTRLQRELRDVQARHQVCYT
jgi:hypothetical protein